MMKQAIAEAFLIAAVVGACAQCGDSTGSLTGTPPDDPPLPPGSEAGDITVSSSIRHQQIVAWESHTQSGENENEDFFSYRDRLFDMAVNELGITRLRLQAYSGMETSQDYFTQWVTGQLGMGEWRCLRFETVNDNADPNVIDWSGFEFSQMDTTVQRVVLPMKQRIEARGEKLYLNVNYNAFVAPCPGGYHHDDPDEYAEFILATFIHLRDKYGLIPDALEVILEPDNTDYWRGTTIGRSLVAAGDRLKANGFTPDFIAPSNTNMGRAVQYFDDMIQVPRVREYLDEFSYHRYGGTNETNLEAIGARAVQYGLRTSMLEHIGSGHEDLHADLKVGLNSSWQQFVLGFGPGDGGGQYFVIDTSRPDPVRFGSRTKYLRQYFYFVRPGAQRIGAATSKPEFDPLAFINEDGKWVVVVKAEAGGSFSIAGLPAGSYGIRYTTNAQFDAAHPDAVIAQGAALHTSIPAEGVITVYGR